MIIFPLIVNLLYANTITKPFYPEKCHVTERFCCRNVLSLSRSLAYINAVLLKWSVIVMFCRWNILQQICRVTERFCRRNDMSLSNSLAYTNVLLLKWSAVVMFCPWNILLRHDSHARVIGRLAFCTL